MTIKILIVDDSFFFRKRLYDLFESHPDIEVIATAENGEEALEKVELYHPDLITMDHEMPVMDGITAVREIMRDHPTPILMISALTYEGASVTLEALEAGALDFVAKQGSDGSNPFVDKNFLCNLVLQLVSSRRGSQAPPVKTESKFTTNPSDNEYELLVVGASTGGPVAVQTLLTNLPKNFPLPIVVAIHMPENFTKAYANRLSKNCRIDVKEAESGDRLISGQALIAPGGKLLKICREEVGYIRIVPKNRALNFAPSVDYLFESAADTYLRKVLAIVLTGMGSDGHAGAKKLRQNDAVVWAQDEQSSVIYGMPGVIAKANLAHRVMNIEEMVSGLKRING